LIMIKNVLLAALILGILLTVGCATGGNGEVSTVDVSVNNVSPNQIYPTQTITVTADTTFPTYANVTWSINGSGWTMISSTPPNPGSQISAMATYQAPNNVGSTATVTAAFTSKPSTTGNAILTVADITTQVAPLTPAVGTGLTQQFAAIPIPEDAPQTFTWICTANGVQCNHFAPSPGVATSGPAAYTADDNCNGNCNVQISAAAPLDPPGCTNEPKFCTIGKASIVSARVSGTYAFRFSGYDHSNHATAVIGTFTVSGGGAISGTEEELDSGVLTKATITGGSYDPITASNPNSNNAGTLTLTAGGSFPDTFQVALDSAGDIEMIEMDSHGTGSGIAQIAAAASVFKGDQTYAFGFTGVDATQNRVGYVGVFPMTGSTVVAGQMDVNDNGNASSICGTAPCAVSGSYSADGCNCGLYHMTLTAGTDASMKFDFFIASGTTNKATPLTLYAISTDPGSNPAVSGTMVLQDSTQTYNNSAQNGTSVSALTGVNGSNANVSLTLGSMDGGGNFSGTFDQNNAGTILTIPTSATEPPFAYTYAASGSSGRYTIQMLGNPDASTVVPPLPFILYASGQNRGFLLDQSSTSVMTGTMNPQGKGGGQFDNSEMPGTYGAATTGSGSSAVDPIAGNLLFTFVDTTINKVVYDNAAGTLYQSGNPSGTAFTGLYTFNNGAAGAGVGQIFPNTTATGPSYAIYIVDSNGCSGAQNSPICSVEDFLMIDENPANTAPSVIFAKE
jgi:hypothetical protein